MEDYTEILELIIGIRGFIRFTNKNETDKGEALSTILHDINGYLSKDKCFLPRTNAYVQQGA